MAGKNGTTATRKINRKAAHRKAAQETVSTSSLTNEKLTQDGPKVYAKMLESVLNGNMPYSRMLAELTEKAGQVRAPDETSTGVSLSEKWSSEPEWAAESDEISAETMPGSREPEN